MAEMEKSNVVEKRLNLLLVEDSPSDAALLVRYLNQHNYDVVYQRVETAEDMTYALKNHSWDIVISDYFLPQFSGMEALALLQQSRPDLPCIILSGKIGEDTAVAAMQAGAYDYIMKSNMNRLAPAIERSLEQVSLRRERNRVEEELRISQGELRLAQQLDKLKDEFMGLISHELRTPLTVIIGALNTVSTEWAKLSESDIRGLVQDALWAGESLQNILTNLLELARVQAGKLQLHNEPINLKRAVEDTVARFKRRINSHQVVVELTEPLPVINGDPIRLERVISNLLDNAAKFSPRNSTIRVFARQSGDEVMVGVSDQGIGISDEDLKKLFRPFQQVGGTAVNRGGTGLGLVVCQRLVEANKGRIWVNSAPGQGSTFYFTVPVIDISPEA